MEDHSHRISDRLSYRRPEIQSLGTVAEITAAGGGDATDSFFGYGPGHGGPGGGYSGPGGGYSGS